MDEGGEVGGGMCPTRPYSYGLGFGSGGGSRLVTGNTAWLATTSFSKMSSQLLRRLINHQMASTMTVRTMKPPIAPPTIAPMFDGWLALLALPPLLEEVVCAEVLVSVIVYILPSDAVDIDVRVLVFTGGGVEVVEDVVGVPRVVPSPEVTATHVVPNSVLTAAVVTGTSDVCVT